MHSGFCWSLQGLFRGDNYHDSSLISFPAILHSKSCVWKLPVNRKNHTFIILLRAYFSLKIKEFWSQISSLGVSDTVWMTFPAETLFAWAVLKILKTMSSLWEKKIYFHNNVNTFGRGTPAKKDLKLPCIKDFPIHRSLKWWQNPALIQRLTIVRRTVDSIIILYYRYYNKC